MTIKRILITGGAGFVGSHVVDAAVARYPDAKIIVFDKMNYAANIHFILDHIRNARVQLIVGDIADFPAVMAATADVDLVLNLAAESHVGRSFGNSIEFTRTNTLGTHMLIEAARRHGIPRFVHISTDEVYGEVLTGEASEMQPLHPNNPYSGSKAAAEMIIQSYSRSFNLPVIITRANNMYGVRQFPEKIIPKFVVNTLTGQPMVLHGDGLHRRHYLAAQDFAEALLLVVENGQVGQAYNIGSDEEYSNVEVARMICQAMGANADTMISYERDRPFNDRRYAVDCSRIKAMGWTRKRALRDELPAIIEWYKLNRELFPLQSLPESYESVAL